MGLRKPLAYRARPQAEAEFKGTLTGLGLLGVGSLKRELKRDFKEGLKGIKKRFKGTLTGLELLGVGSLKRDLKRDFKEGLKAIKKWFKKELKGGGASGLRGSR